MSSRYRSRACTADVHALPTDRDGDRLRRRAKPMTARLIKGNKMVMLDRLNTISN
jgi:hypothetical protein